MQSVNRQVLSNIAFLLPLFSAGTAAAVFATDIVSLTSIYAFSESHLLDFNIVILNFIWLLVLCVPHDSSFISNQFFDLIYCAKNLLYFDILLLY